MSTRLRNMLAIGLTGMAVTLASAQAGAAGHTPKGSASATDAPPGDTTLPTGRGALRQIVQNLCVLNWLQHQNPSPCERVVLADPKAGSSGYAVLADPGGGAHYLLIPTQTMVGLDSSELLDPDAPNYFAEAWHARDLMTKFVGHPVPRTAIGLAVNTAQTRSYDQFHIHIECIRQDVFDSLRAASEQITAAWAPLNVAGATFQAMRISGEGLDDSNLFESLASLKPDVTHHIGDYTLVAVGAQFSSGPGFIVLTGTGPTGEFLLDSGCIAAGGGG